MERTNIYYPGIWTKMAGASTLVKIGHRIEMSGMVASDPNGMLVGGSSGYEQTKYIFKKAQKLLEDVGSGLQDIIKIKVYTIDMGLVKDIAKAHEEILGEYKPCSTIIEATKLILPEYLVCVEVSAYTFKD
jgi:enamine deaminase RidA (YjgF/YER057c/UK114 family)